MIFRFMLVLVSQLGCIVSRDLHLLALVPLGNSNGSVCLDFGEELIPAAEIAAERINANSNLLADFKLRIVPAATDQCSNPSIARALGSFANYTTNQSMNIVGMIGLVCPSALLSLSRIASLSAFNILHITSSTTSPSIVASSRGEDIGLLYQIAPSSVIFNKAVVGLMKKNGWKQISVIRHTESISIEHDNIASDFRQKIEMESELSIRMYSEAASRLDRFVNQVRVSGTRIVYASVTRTEALELLCISYRENVSWPNYLWIFHDFSFADLLHNTTQCSIEEMERALEGVVLLQHHIDSDMDRTIDYTGYSYSEYYSMYTKRLQNVTSRPTCNQIPQLLNANALHDSVLAFADALNKSLSSTDFDCHRSLRNRTDCNTTKILEGNLKDVRFRGAGGELSFNDKTHTLLVDSLINIYQVLNGSLSLLTQFNGTITEESVLSNINYTFERRIAHIHLAFPVITLIAVTLCVIATFVTLFFSIYFRNSLDIKAMSPPLSYLVLFACFLLYISATATAARFGFASGQAYGNLCAVEPFFFVLGVQLIFATLFVRLLRVSRIFFRYSQVGVAWSDKLLVLYIMIIMLVSMVLLVLWMIIGDFRAGERANFIYDVDPPYYTVNLRCSARYEPIFLSLVWGYAGIFIVLVILLAIKTRKVSIDIFKDTKSVNIFVFCSVGALTLFVPLSYITLTLSGTAALILSYLFQVLSVLVVAIACISLLFAPKIYFSLFPSARPIRSKSVGNRESLAMSLPRANSDHKTSGVKISLP